MRLTIGFVFWLMGCTGDPKTEQEESEPEVGLTDADSDGYLSDVDCNDSQADIHPGAMELCDGLDNDCDDEIDEGVLTTSYADMDEDGYGDPGEFAENCEILDGYVPIGTDCNDSDPESYPGASERCDGRDNDCDGEVDEDLTTEWFPDVDGDGYGDDEQPMTDCDPEGGLVAEGGDCADDSADVHPGATEICDEIDNDCDGDVDEGVLTTWYADSDGDGYGDIYSDQESCEEPSGYVSSSTDCDDEDSEAYPSASEVCDYVDQDCDGSTDEDFRTGVLYTDPAHCGYCGNDCSGYVFDHATTFCDTAVTTPECGFSCDTGFYDANEDPDDGCECAQISTTDEPFDGIDQDCDGLDGDHSDAIHVSVDTGSPSGDGSQMDPLDSIQDGIDQATTVGLTYVLVAEGEYDEDIELVPGQILYGGYDVYFEERDVVTYDSSIIGTGDASATVMALEITTATVFNGFVVQGNASTIDGSTAIGIWIEDSDSSLEISDSVISADDAFDGGDSDNGEDGEDGLDGSDGQAAKLGTCSSLSSGGSGAAKTCPDGDTPDGGDGADASCPNSGANQDDGDRGAGASGGTGGTGACDAEISRGDCGLCSVDTACWGTGGDGDFGGDGDHGTGGPGAVDAGASSGSRWVPEDGSDGDPGDSGSGGGGGGAGSGVEVYSSCGYDHISATGGGGGSGGCGGQGGEGGQGGGSSIGILITCTGTCSSLPVIDSNEISSADAGDGGDGGHGGTGGMGGYGGLGGEASSSAWCALDGGEGADGGEGGNGGGGGGGAGGHSYAVYVENLSPTTTWISSSNITDFGYAGHGGSGGAGGDSSTHGVDGADGEEGKQNW